MKGHRVPLQFQILNGYGFASEANVTKLLVHGIGVRGWCCRTLSSSQARRGDERHYCQSYADGRFLAQMSPPGRGAREFCIRNGARASGIWPKMVCALERTASTGNHENANLLTAKNAKKSRRDRKERLAGPKERPSHELIGTPPTPALKCRRACYNGDHIQPSVSCLLFKRLG